MKFPARRRFSTGCNGTLCCCCVSNISLFLYSAQEWCASFACCHKPAGVVKPAPHSWHITGACNTAPRSEVCSGALPCSSCSEEPPPLTVPMLHATRTKCATFGEGTELAGT